LLEIPSAKRAGELHNLNRNQLRIMMGLLQDTVIEKDVSKLGLMDSPACDRHKQASDMASHILCDCQAVAGTGSIKIQVPRPSFLEMR
jgi:hypothetical protein